MNTGAKVALRRADIVEGVKEVQPQILYRVGTSVRQAAFCLRPDAFVRIQLGGVGRKMFQTKTRKAPTQIPDRLAFVYAGVVPDDDERAAEVLQQVAQESTDLGVFNVSFLQGVVQTEPLALGTDRQARYDRDAMANLMMVNVRRLAARRPCLANRRDQEEARFVDEYDVGAQPRSVFFILGHSLRFHCSMACSSRWRARRSGFW